MMDFINVITNLPIVVQRGILVGLLTSVCASLLGVTLVLKRFSMIGDGLSHIAFGSMSIALVLGLAPLTFSLPVVIVCAFLLLRLNKKSTFGGDSAIAAVSSASLATGIFAVSLAGGVNTSVNDYMFGSIVAISRADAIMCVPFLVIVICVFVLLYNRIFALTFDENFAKASGVVTERYNMMIALLTALTVVIGMRIMGTLLISGLIVFPALSAMRLFSSFKRVTITAAIISCVCFLCGTAASIILDSPVGASIVIFNAIVFCVCTLLSRIVRS